VAIEYQWEDLRARYRSAVEIARYGAIGNLGEGAEIDAHGVPTRLIAWPGTGYQTEAVHVLTLDPGVASERYAYELAEEALLCYKGSGEVWLRERWVSMRAGDIAYVPEGLERALRNPAGDGAPFVVVTQITPPQFDLYADHGFYNVEAGVMNFDAISKACANSGRVALGDENEMAFHDSDADVRSWCLSRDEVRRDGALFNVMMGAPFTGIGLPMRLVLWPGAGCRTAGFNYAFAPDGITDVIHKHPVSDECLTLWSGQGWFFVGDRWVPAQAGDCALAPQGVVHGHRSDGDCHFGGFASPPQLDLLLPTEYYTAGRFLPPEATRLDLDGT
jgi:gentisate 1,2-dioxygenase